MARKLNHLSGIMALIAVGCLVAFGSAGERLVNSAAAQPTGSGSSDAQPITFGNCNRCAWSYKQVEVPNVQPGTDLVVFPRGTRGAFRMNTFFPDASGYLVHADCLETGASGLWNLSPQLYVQYTPDSSGVRFVDGLIVRYEGNPSTVKLALEYRLD